MPPAPVTRSATVPLRPDGSLVLAVVADTHSQPHARTAATLRALAPDAILHGGDIGDLGVLDALAAIAPVHAVRGNIDTRAPALPDVLLLDVLGEVDGAPRRLRLLLTHIAVAGPRIRAEVAKAARAHGASLIVCGHSHVPFIGQDRGLTVFNPGSCGPRRFQLPIVCGALTVSAAGTLALRHVDVETGATWLP